MKKRLESFLRFPRITRNNDRPLPGARKWCSVHVEFAVCRCPFLSGRYIAQARHPLARFPPLRGERGHGNRCWPVKRIRNTVENSPVLFTGAEGKMPRINRGRQEAPDHLLGMAGTRYISIYARSGPDAAAAMRLHR